MSEIKAGSTPLFDQHVPLLFLFGLIAPPLMTFMNTSQGKLRQPVWWPLFEKYVDPMLTVAWGSLLLGLSGFYAIGAMAAPGLGLCVFFTAGGLGFFLGRLIEKQYKRG